MSLWSDIKLKVPGVAHSDLFGEYIDSKKYGRFSKKQYGVSGYYTSEFLLVLLEPLKKKVEGYKKIYKAQIIELSKAGFPFSETVFKRMSYARQITVENVLDGENHGRKDTRRLAENA